MSSRPPGWHRRVLVAEAGPPGPGPCSCAACAVTAESERSRRPATYRWGRAGGRDAGPPAMADAGGGVCGMATPPGVGLKTANPRTRRRAPPAPPRSEGLCSVRQRPLAARSRSNVPVSPQHGVGGATQAGACHIMTDVGGGGHGARCIFAGPGNPHCSEKGVSQDGRPSRWRWTSGCGRHGPYRKARRTPAGRPVVAKPEMARSAP